MLKKFVVYIGDSQTDYVKSINELSNAEPIGYYDYRIDAFTAAKNITGKPAIILLQEFVLQNGILTLINSGSGQNIMSPIECYSSGGNGMGTIDWGDVQNKPSTFPPLSHGHTLNQITDFNSANYATAAQGQKADTAVQQNTKGMSNGVASLGGDGKVPAAQLPDIGGYEPPTGGIPQTDLSSEVQGLLNKINDCVGLPEYEQATHTITFTTKDGNTFAIDLPLEALHKGWTYDPSTKEFVITQLDNTVVRVDASDFVKVYIGSVSDQIQITIDTDGTVRASILANSIDIAKLDTSLRDLINSKIDRDDLDAHNEASDTHIDIRDDLTDLDRFKANKINTLSGLTDFYSLPIGTVINFIYYPDKGSTGHPVFDAGSTSKMYQYVQDSTGTNTYRFEIDNAAHTISIQRNPWASNSVVIYQDGAWKNLFYAFCNVKISSFNATVQTIFGAEPCTVFAQGRLVDLIDVHNELDARIKHLPDDDFIRDRANKIYIDTGITPSSLIVQAVYRDGFVTTDNTLPIPVFPTIVGISTTSQAVFNKTDGSNEESFRIRIVTYGDHSNDAISLVFQNEGITIPLYHVSTGWATTKTFVGTFKLPGALTSTNAGIIGNIPLFHLEKDLIDVYNELTALISGINTNGGDADTLQGHHASDFALANHEHPLKANKIADTSVIPIGEMSLDTVFDIIRIDIPATSPIPSWSGSGAYVLQFTNMATGQAFGYMMFDCANQRISTNLNGSVQYIYQNGAWVSDFFIELTNTKLAYVTGTIPVVIPQPYFTTIIYRDLPEVYEELKQVNNNVIQEKNLGNINTSTYSSFAAFLQTQNPAGSEGMILACVLELPITWTDLPVDTTTTSTQSLVIELMPHAGGTGIVRVTRARNTDYTPIFVNRLDYTTGMWNGTWQTLATREWVLNNINNPTTIIQMLPDYANMESTNRISANGGTWTVDRVGYIYFSALFSSALGTGAVQVQINGKVVRLEGNTNISEATGGITGSILQVGKNDVVSISSYGANNAISNIVCYFIPPRYVELEV